MLIIPGLVALGIIHWRNRHPVLTAVIIAVALFFSLGPIGAVFAVQAEIAFQSKKHLIPILTASALFVCRVLGMLVWYPPLFHLELDSPTQWEIFVSLFAVVTATLWGLLAAGRNSVHERTQEAEAAHQRAEEAVINETRLAEREQIAREMHDVVAHRMSIIAMQAGGLACRSVLTEAEVKDVARQIQTTAREALAELRTMLTSLRGVDLPPALPQPTLEQINVLMAEAEAAGQPISMTRSGNLEGLPDPVSRQAFRIVQEGLTNARKHAPGESVDVTIRADSNLLSIEVANDIVDLPVTGSGRGLGLLGAIERAELLNGTCSHRISGGRFILSVQIPLTTYQ